MRSLHSLRERIAGWRRPRAAILLYHRVAALEADPQLLSVAPARFAQHLDHLRAHYRPMPLPDLAQALRRGRVPHRAIALTFDDGYADNLHHAKPLLEASQVPATVFIVTGHMGQAHEFWWDELERLLLLPGARPETLTLAIDGEAHAWRLGAAASYSADDYARHRGWTVLDAADPTPRHAIYRALHPLLRPLSPAQRAAALAQLQTWAGVDAAARPTHRALQPGEVAALAAGGLVEVGAHTVNHPVLAALPPAAQRAEIAESQARLSALTGRLVTSFSYPYGALGDYTAETVALVREVGFTCACANFAGRVEPGVDPFALPRFIVRDWDLATFAGMLEAWFGD